MFDAKSRYANLETYTVNICASKLAHSITDCRGRTVAVVPVPDAPEEVSIGLHILRQGQRIDHLAYKYLDDQAGYWRICELNDVMLPEALTEAQEISIPRKRR